MEQKIGRILSDFSFPNFVGSDWIHMLIYRNSKSRKTQSAHLWPVGDTMVVFFTLLCKQFKNRNALLVCNFWEVPVS